MEVVRTRLDPPPEPSDLLARTRLLERLDDLAAARVTMLQAPPAMARPA